MTVALVPARAGSKRLPGKNLLPLAGRPLLEYAVRAGLDSGVIDALYVSTDDPAVASLGEALGARPWPLRPAELATDEATSQQVVEHFLAMFEQRQGALPQTLVLLQPTSPLRTAVHVREALSLYARLPKPATLVSVAPHKPVSWQGQIDESGRFQPRQGTGENFILNGALYCTSGERARESLSGPPLYAYVMPFEASVDVDTATDFRLAEALLSKMVDENAPGG